MWENEDNCTLLVGMWNDAAAVETSVVFPQNKICIITMCSSNFTSVYMSKRTENRGLNRYLYSHVHNREKQPKCLLRDEWVNKMCYMQSIEHDSDFKKNKILLYTIISVNLGNIKLS